MYQLPKNFIFTICVFSILVIPNLSLGLSLDEAMGEDGASTQSSDSLLDNVEIDRGVKQQSDAISRYEKTSKSIYKMCTCASAHNCDWYIGEWTYALDDLSAQLRDTVSGMLSLCNTKTSLRPGASVEEIRLAADKNEALEKKLSDLSADMWDANFWGSKRYEEIAAKQQGAAYRERLRREQEAWDREAERNNATNNWEWVQSDKEFWEGINKTYDSRMTDIKRVEDRAIKQKTASQIEQRQSTDTSSSLPTTRRKYEDSPQKCPYPDSFGVFCPYEDDAECKARQEENLKQVEAYNRCLEKNSAPSDGKSTATTIGK